jgi:hypothetical protein
MPFSGKDSIIYGSTSDLPTDIDTLGFDVYVDSIAEYLIDSHTNAPLTLSIEGPWGSGKSTFMKLLQVKIRGRLGARATIVEFNAWRHDREEALWAAFALAAVHQIAKSRSILHRCAAQVQLAWSRFRWAEGWPEAARALLLTSFLLISAVWIPVLVLRFGPGPADKLAKTLAGQVGSEPGAGQPHKAEKESQSKDPLYQLALLGIQAGGVTGTATLIVYLLYLVVKIVGNPLELKLRKHLAMPDYEGKTAFVENFHKDFRRILDAYVGPVTKDNSGHKRLPRVFIFIDDLDRCEFPKAAELMSAINLLISNDERLIFILGLDRQKVAAAVAFKHKEILPFLASRQALGYRLEGSISESNSKISAQIKEQRESAANSDTGIRFGYDFLEKFIQVPFALPSPGRGELQSFLEAMWHPKRLEQAAGENLPESGKRAWDESRVIAVASLLTETFKNNPRRIKQFVNLFRLRLFTAQRTGKLEVAEGVTLEQLGKVTAIMMRWPNFVEAWLADSDLLAGLQLAAMKQFLPAYASELWFGNLELRKLLRLSLKETFGADAAADGQGIEIPSLDPSVRLDTVQRDSVIAIAPTKIAGLSRDQARHQLRQFALDYQEIRSTQPPGQGRTQAMNALYWEMLKIVPQTQLTEDWVKQALKSGTDGERISALAAIYSWRRVRDSFLNLFSELCGSISSPRSAFEQYRALRCAEEGLKHIKVDKDKDLLRGSIEIAKERRDWAADWSRAALAEELLKRLTP